VASALADRLGLPVYRLEDHAAPHEARLPPVAEPDGPPPLEWVVARSRHRLRLVLEDLRALPDGPGVVVEGLLFPTSVSAVGRPGRALFVVPDADDPVARVFEREARDLRLPLLRDEPGVVERALELASGGAGTSR
jgi:hypothetical protein